MTALTALWLPILVSAIFVFIASAIIHMAPLWHQSDYPAPPDQDRLGDAMRPFNLRPGDYLIPRAKSHAEMKSPEFVEKANKGPVVLMTVFPNGSLGMGQQLTTWFVYTLIVSLFAGYVAGRALPPGVDYLEVFRFAGTTAFIAYSVALWQMSIWYRRSWSLTIKETFDGLIYGLLTAGVFGWLWPS